MAELERTTRDIPDYDELMRHRLAVLEEHGITMADVRSVVSQMDPLPGAVAFVETLRSVTQVVILSDTFEEFVPPLMAKLGYPTLFCNNIIVDGDDRIVDYKLRQKDGKRRAVTALQSLNLTVFAAGDSYNDLSMIGEADRGALFQAPKSIREEYPAYPALESYEELLAFLTAPESN